MGRVSWGLARSQEIADGGRGEGIDAERRRDKPNRQCADHKDAELLRIDILRLWLSEEGWAS